MTEKKTMKDLEGWTSMGSTPGLIGSYTLLISPDKKRVAQVHLQDDEVSMIFNREEKKIEYIHPITAIGMKKVGVTKKDMEQILGTAYEKEEGGGQPD